MPDLTSLELVLILELVAALVFSPLLWVIFFILKRLQNSLELALGRQENLTNNLQGLITDIQLMHKILKASSNTYLEKHSELTYDSDIVIPAPIKEKVVAIWPTAKNYPPLNTFNDFSEFVNSLPQWELIALVGHVPSSKLVNTFRKFKRNQEAITIFYAATHGSDRGILLTNGWLQPRNLAELLVIGNVKLAILMTCDSSEIAQTLRRNGVPAVIYIEGKIEDKKAIKVMKSVMQSLADGLTIQESVNLAKTEIDIITGHALLHTTFSHNFRIYNYE